MKTQQMETVPVLSGAATFSAGESSTGIAETERTPVIKGDTTTNSTSPSLVAPQHAHDIAIMGFDPVAHKTRRHRHGQLRTPRSIRCDLTIDRLDPTAVGRFPKRSRRRSRNIDHEEEFEGEEQWFISVSTISSYPCEKSLVCCMIALDTIKSPLDARMFQDQIRTTGRNPADLYRLETICSRKYDFIFMQCSALFLLLTAHPQNVEGTIEQK